MRPQALNPARLPLLFRKELEMCKVKPGSLVILVTDLTTRLDYIQAAFAAAADLGIKVYELKIATPFVAGQIASQGGGDALLSLPGAIEAIESAELVLVFHISLGSAWMQRARKKGVRFLLVIDGPDELECLLSPPGLKEAVLYTRDLFQRTREMHVSSEAGTDFRCRLGELNTVCQYGYADEPGCVDTWGGAHVSTWANPGSSEGIIALQPGDSWILPYVRFIETPVRLIIEKSIIRKIEGEGTDAKLLAQYFEKSKRHPGDLEPYHVSHLGWGLNPNSAWDQLAVHGNDMARIASHTRAWPGVFLFSTGPDDQGGGKNSTRAHVDLPMMGCTVRLDGRIVIDRGTVVDPKMIVQRGPALQAAA